MVKSLINLKKLFESEILRFHVLKESEKNINCFILNKLFVLMQVFFSNLFFSFKFTFLCFKSHLISSSFRPFFQFP